jgi:hypothetical protein
VGPHPKTGREENGVQVSGCGFEEEADHHARRD